jgi:hypothetical protein
MGKTAYQDALAKMKRDDDPEVALSLWVDIDGDAADDVAV